MLAPLTLFIVLSFVNVPSAVVLLVCVPLIPIAIAAVQTWAKKLLSRYWGQYTALGDTFLENLQGLITLKIYQTDAFKDEEMNREAAHRAQCIRRWAIKQKWSRTYRLAALIWKPVLQEKQRKSSRYDEHRELF